MHIIYKRKRTRCINMQLIKYFILFLILVSSSLIGRFLSKRYLYRLEELEEMNSALNVFKSKIKFTYEPIPEIFKEISENTNKNIGNIFLSAKEKMKYNNANIAWESALKESNTNLKEEDKQILKNLSKMLGQTDSEGQISQIEITQNFLETQIKDAQQEKQKNEKLYSRLGTTIGLAIVIILI